MVFAVDYNQTYNLDPEAFREMIVNLKKRSHTCIMVTSRHDGTPEAEEVRTAIGNLVPIVFAGDVWKDEAARAAGYNVDVWLDDRPAGIRSHRPHSKHHWTYSDVNGWVRK